MPGLLTWRFILDLPLPVRGKYLETALLGFAFLPSYFIFCLALMALTAAATRLLGWRSPPGVHELAELPWPVIRWAQYNAATHLVRLFAGGALRATIFWTWFLRANGANIGRGVHINTLSIYDHNLLTIGDGTVIGSDVHLSAHTTERGRLIVDPVLLGARVTIGTSAIIYPGVVVGDGTQVGAMSLVPKRTQLPPGGVYAGVPVQPLEKPDADTYPPPL